MPSLFDPVRMGAIEAPNRIFMAPLSRSRATRDHVPTPLMVEYYKQRASAGLIISEATVMREDGHGFPYAPGIYRPAHVEGWKSVTRAVHEAGGRIVCQIQHCGRLSHPSYGGPPVPISSSATRVESEEVYTYEGKQPSLTARAMEIEDIHALTRSFVTAAENAMEAGFDGVQIHGANGYIFDQFMRDNSNFRTDEYGGSIENRIRFLIETAEAVADAIGADRTSVRLSPNGPVQGVDDSNQDALFTAAARALSPIGMAFLELRDVGPHGTFGASDRLQVAPLIRRVYNGPIVLNADYTPVTGQHALDIGLGDAIAFGRPFIANPDLPRRIGENLPLAEANMETWYSQGAEGYIDYPMAP